MRTDSPMLTRHQFWKLLYQRLEQQPGFRDKSAGEFEVLKEQLWNPTSEVAKNDTEQSRHYRASVACAVQQLLAENGLTQREVAQRGKFHLPWSKELKSTRFRISLITSFIDRTRACALHLLLKSPRT